MNNDWYKSSNFNQTNAQNEQSIAWKEYIFGNPNERNNPLCDNYSQAYNEVIYQLLSDGLSDALEDTFGIQKKFAMCIANEEYGVTFSVGLSKTGNAMPALDNFVYSYTQNEENGENPIYIDSNYMNSASPFIMPILSERGLNDLESFMGAYPSKILNIMDRITSTLNDYYNDTTLHYAFNTGVIEWGGIMFFPTIQGNQVVFKFELSTDIKNKLKTDTRFSNSDE